MSLSVSMHVRLVENSRKTSDLFMYLLRLLAEILVTN